MIGRFVRGARRRWTIRRVLRARLFDQPFYELQVRRTFGDDREAMAHFLAEPPARARSPHPLVEPAWLENRGGTAGSWIRIVFTRRHRGMRALGPALTFPDARGPFSRSAAGLWRSWMRDRGEGALLPGASADVSPTIPEAARRMREVAMVFERQDRISTERNRTTWDDNGRHEVAIGGVLVSIVLPTRDRRDLLLRAIESVRAQSYGEWELLVVDDGSTDGTADVVAALSDVDQRIRLIRQTGLGVSAARNNGISVARGDLVAFLDSDNVWTPEFVATAVAALRGSPRAFAHGVAEVRGDDGGVEYVGRPVTRDQLLGGRNVIDLNALVVRRAALDVVGGFDDSLRRWTDYDLVLRLSALGDGVFVPAIAVHYDHRTSASDRITVRESPMWRRVVIDKNAVDRDQWRATMGGRIPSRVSVLMRTRNTWSLTADSITDLLRLASLSGVDVEVVVVDNASRREESAILTATFLSEPRVAVQRFPFDQGVEGSANIAFSASTGETVVVAEPSTRWSGALLTAIRRGEHVAHDGIVRVTPAADFIASGGFALADAVLADSVSTSG